MWKTLLLITITLFLGLSQATVYQVTSNIGSQAPLDDLAAGDVVEIHYKATPYREKYEFC